MVMVPSCSSNFQELGLELFDNAIQVTHKLEHHILYFLIYKSNFHFIIKFQNIMLF